MIVLLCDQSSFSRLALKKLDFYARVEAWRMRTSSGFCERMILTSPSANVGNELPVEAAIVKLKVIVKSSEKSE